MRHITSVCHPFVAFTSNHVETDNVCIESLSIDLTRPMLDSAARSVGKLGERIEEWVLSPPWSALFKILRRIKITDAAKLQDEYVKLVEGLQEAVDDDNDSFMSNPGRVPLWVFIREAYSMKFFQTTC